MRFFDEPLPDTATTVTTMPAISASTTPMIVIGSHSRRGDGGGGGGYPGGGEPTWAKPCWGYPVWGMPPVAGSGPVYCMVGCGSGTGQLCCGMFMAYLWWLRGGATQRRTGSRPERLVAPFR